MRLSKRVRSAKQSRQTSPVGAVDPGSVFAQSGGPAGECGFPMIGKYFSNGWKKWAGFSNDWKKFSCVFQ
jgi:hypothetical protein